MIKALAAILFVLFFPDYKSMCINFIKKLQNCYTAMIKNIDVASDTYSTEDVMILLSWFSFWSSFSENTVCSVKVVLRRHIQSLT